MNGCFAFLMIFFVSLPVSRLSFPDHGYLRHVSGDTRHRHFDNRHECYMYGQLYGLFATHMNAGWTWCLEWLVRHGHSHL